MLIKRRATSVNEVRESAPVCIKAEHELKLKWMQEEHDRKIYLLKIKEKLYVEVMTFKKQLLQKKLDKFNKASDKNKKEPIWNPKRL